MLLFLLLLTDATMEFRKHNWPLDFIGWYKMGMWHPCLKIIRAYDSRALYQIWGTFEGRPLCDRAGHRPVKSVLSEIR